MAAARTLALALVLAAGCQRSVEFVAGNDLAMPPVSGEDAATSGASDGPGGTRPVDAAPPPDLAFLPCTRAGDCPDSFGQRRCCGGRCVDASRDRLNCGECGNDCGPPAFPGWSPRSCFDGRCEIIECWQGHTDCDGIEANFCETDIANDPSNCGGCRKVCPRPIAHGLPTCIEAKCAPICEPGYGDCNFSFPDGCEVNLGSDDKNCGRCGTVCPPNMRCVGGGCL